MWIGWLFTFNVEAQLWTPGSLANPIEGHRGDAVNAAPPRLTRGRALTQASLCVLGPTSATS
jgi:hypothetical protein